MNSEMYHADINGFSRSMLTAFTVVFFTEIGDKTFFMAAVLAMNHNRWLVFCGCSSALFIMTCFSAAFGSLAPQLASAEAIYWFSVVLFLFFGVMCLKEYIFSNEGGHEMEDAEDQVAVALVSEPQVQTSSVYSQPGSQQSLRAEPLLCRAWKKLSASVMAKAFTATVLAEWGDPSQIATITLASRYNVAAVALGGGAGVVLCIGAAVMGGKTLSTYIDERTINLLAGVMFLLFSAITWYEGY